MGGPTRLAVEAELLRWQVAYRERWEQRAELRRRARAVTGSTRHPNLPVQAGLNPVPLPSWVGRAPQVLMGLPVARVKAAVVEPALLLAEVGGAVVPAAAEGQAAWAAKLAVHPSRCSS